MTYSRPDPSYVTCIDERPTFMSESRPTRRVIFYTKPGCHLCEQAEDLLDDLRADIDLTVEAIDITTDLAVFERYKYEIPVIAVDGGSSVSGRIDRTSLYQALGLDG